MISQDSFSKYTSWIGLSIPVYVFLFSNISIIWLFPSFLLLFGLAMQKWLMPKAIPDITKASTTEDEGNIFYYTVIALATFVFLGLVTPPVVKIFKLELTGYDSILFGVMMAIGEEQFFRAGWANLLVQASRSEVYGALAGAGVFLIYHFAAYQDNPSALFFVLGAGFTLIYVDLRTNRLSPSMFAHIANNLMVYSTIGLSAIAMLLFQYSQILILIGVIAVIVVLYRQKGKRKQKR